MPRKTLNAFNPLSIILALILLFLLMVLGGCSKIVSRVINTGLFETHEVMALAYHDLRERFSREEALTIEDVRTAGFIPEKEMDGKKNRVPGVEIYIGQEAFERYFGVSQQSLAPQSPEERAAEKKLWRIEKYPDVDVRGKRPYIFINTEESEEKGPEMLYTFVFRGIRIVDMPQINLARGVKESSSGFLSGPVGGMGRITEGVGKGLGAAF